MTGVESISIGCVVVWLFEPFLEPDFVLPFSARVAEAFACLLRLLFGWAASESKGMVSSGDRALLADAFLVEVEEDLAPAGSGFAIF
jgi:hypothetical protein